MICKRRRKRLYTFVMALNAAVWIFFVCISWNCCQGDRQQFILDYNIVDKDVGGSNPVDESVYQRDILEGADAHFALYHKDDTHRVRRPLLSGGSNQGLGQQRYNEKESWPSSDNILSGRQSKLLQVNVEQQQQSVINKHSDIQSNSEHLKSSSSQDSDTLVSPTARRAVRLSSLLNSNSVDSHHDSYSDRLDGRSLNRKVQEPKTKGLDEDQTEGEKRRLPQAVIIGVKKGGTRALLEYLKMHPDVKAPGPEPHFFDKNYDKGYQWYREQMPPSLASQLTIEKTPSYFITKEVPNRMHGMSPDLRLLVVVRDPVTRAISDYAQGLDRRPDLKPFEQMAFLDNSTEIVNTSWGAIKIGLYVSHLERWLKFFDMEQIHFVDGERLISQPALEMRKVQEFLNLRQFINETHFSLDFSQKGFPCMKKPWGQGRVHCLDKSKGRAHPIVEPKALKRLQEFYKPFNEKLADILGYSFGW